MPREGRAYIGFSCDPELKKRALKIAKLSGRASLGSVCRKALESYLDDQGYNTQILQQVHKVKIEEK